MESDRDRRFALEGFVRYHDDRIWKQTQKLVREEKEAITKMGSYPYCNKNNCHAAYLLVCAS